MEKYLYNIILRLSKKHEIVVFTSSKFRDTTINNVKMYYFVDRDIIRYFNLFLRLFSIFLFVPYILLKERPKIISAFTPSSSATILFIWAKIFRIKTIINLRGVWGKYERIMILMGEFIFFFSDAIIINAKELRDKYPVVIHIPKTYFLGIKCYYIPNAVDSDFWTPLPNIAKKYDVVNIANLQNIVRVRKKGFANLYNAIRILKNKENISIRTMIIGDYNLRVIKGEIKNFKEGYIEFVGRISEKEILRKKVQEAKIYVTSSNVEGMSNSLMEALSMGMPCITTDVGAARALIKDGYNGLIVEKGNSEELASAIKKLLDNKDLRAKFSENARDEMIKRYSWEKNIALVEKTYNKILKGN